MTKRRKQSNDWMKGGLFGVEDFSDNPDTQMAIGQQAQAIAQGKAAETDAKLTQARIADVDEKHALCMLLGVTAAASALAGILHMATAKTGDDVKRKLQEKLHSQSLSGKVNQAQAKKIIDDAEKAIKKMRKEVHPWKMRMKGGAKMVAIAAGALALINGVYYAYIKVAKKILEKKSEEYHDIADQKQIVPA